MSETNQTSEPSGTGTGPAPRPGGGTASRVLSGMRPTGALHVGNLLGALDNWVAMQDEYECFFAVVDWHALTTDYAAPGDVRANVRDLALDFLGAGLDPERCRIFVQSHVKEHAELHLLISMIVPLGWLYRVPTYKEQIRELSGRELETYGFLGYPVLQSADILAYRADLVPVGEDQVAHLELTREIARRFNALYRPVFPEPKPKHTKTLKLPGLDGRKMSKSYDNAIQLKDDVAATRKRISTMKTDPARKRRTDPGEPTKCPVYAFHRVLSSPEQLDWVETGCRTAGIGCLECKGVMADNLASRLEPIQARREEFAAKPDTVREILAEGARKARRVAGETLAEVREAMGLD